MLKSLLLDKHQFYIEIKWNFDLIYNVLKQEIYLGEKLNPNFKYDVV